MHMDVDLFLLLAGADGLNSCQSLAVAMRIEGPGLDIARVPWGHVGSPDNQRSTSNFWLHAETPLSARTGILGQTRT
jgi:hypothetical protein